MASNKELQDAIAARAAVLGLTVDTAGMNNATLTETLKGLNEQKTAEELAADAAAAAAPAPAAKAAKRKGYFVADGKSVTSARGILAAGEEVRENDIPAEARDALVDLDIIEKL